MTDESSPEIGPEDSGNSENPPLRARVPDHVADGVFSTGAIVMTGPTEFIVDFLRTVGRPQLVASRVIIPHQVMPQLIEALQTNLDLYRNRFGDPFVPQSQQPNPDARRPTPQEIYDDLKLPDEILSGTYANGVMIVHGATEFSLDFLTTFFPQSAVCARIFLSSGQVPRFLESLKGAVRQFELRQQEQRRQHPDALPPQPPGNDSHPPASPGDSSNDPPESDQ